MDQDKVQLLRVLSVILEQDESSPVFQLISKGLSENNEFKSCEKMSMIRKIVNEKEVSVFG